jgi:type VI secretion system protein ImpE
MATEHVRNRPTDIPYRSILVEFLCFAGELERADKQLDALLRIDPSSMHGVSLLRHLIRAEISRREVFEQGRIPEFSGPPSEALQLRLQAAIALRQNQFAEAAALIEQASNLEPTLRGTVDGTPFEGFSDLDDLLGPVLEVFTATGAYYWIDCSQILRLEFDPVTHLSDTLWRSASIQTNGGIDGRIHVPAIYLGSEKSADPRVTLGRTTEWIPSSDEAVTRGAGQREFLFGDDVLPILNIRNLSFSQDNA